MKIKQFLLIPALFGISVSTAIAQQVPCYFKYRDEGIQEMRQKKFSDANNLYWLAFLCSDKPEKNDLSDLIQQCQANWVRDLEVSVQQQKVAYEAAVTARQEAEASKVSEEKARREAEKNARKAREQGIRAESLRMALVSDMVRQKGRISDALTLAYLALQMAGPDLSPPMMRAFGDAVRDSFTHTLFNSPDILERMEPLNGNATGVLLKINGGNYYILRDGSNDMQSQVTRLDSDLSNVTASPRGDRFIGWGKSPKIQIFDATGAEVAVLTGHSEPIRTAAFSPDGQLIVTGSRDNTARLWSHTGNPLAVLDGHTGNVQQVVFAPDGSYFLTRASDGTARTWSLQGTLLAVFQADDAYLRTVCIAPDSKQIAAVFSDGQARLHTPDGKQITALNPKDQPAKDVIFAAASPILAVCVGAKTVQTCTTSGTALATCIHQTEVTGMALAADGSALLTWAKDHVVRLWDNHGKLLHELRGHRTDVTEAAFSPDGRHILTTSKDGTTKLWDLEGNILTDWVSGPNALVQFLPNETAMLTVMNGGRSVARIPFPEQIYGQMNRQDVLDSAGAKAVLEEFKVQFLDALTARQ